MDYRGYYIELGDTFTVAIAPGCVLEFASLGAAKSYIDDTCEYNDGH